MPPHEQSPNTPLRVAVRLVRAALVLVGLVGAAVLLGGLSGGGAGAFGSHGQLATPLGTVLAALVLTIGLAGVSPRRRPRRWAWLALATVGALALVEGVARAIFGTPPALLPWLPPALSIAGAGQGLAGLATLTTLGTIAAGQLLRRAAPHGAFAMAAFAPVAPLIAAFGYTFGFARFQGEMTLVTVAMLLPLSLVGLVSFLRRPMLRPLFAATPLARGMRAELLVGLALPWAIGAALAWGGPGDTAKLAIQSALMAFFAGFVVLVKSKMHAETERARQRSVRALKAAALTDPLTGVANRHGAQRRFDRLAEGRSVGVILADLDHFKALNDAWGHNVGDRVLADAAQALQSVLGPGDTIARWGGEEFLIVLPGVGLARTSVVAERLRRSLRAVPRPGGATAGSGGGSGGVTASFGVAERAGGEDDLEAAIQRADAALYRAKNAGRDRVMRDQVGPAPVTPARRVTPVGPIGTASTAKAASAAKAASQNGPDTATSQAGAVGKSSAPADRPEAAVAPEADVAQEAAMAPEPGVAARAARATDTRSSARGAAA